ncbi:MAG: substrate-binding domain-containing protein, partial [Chloroflexota bacterium]
QSARPEATAAAQALELEFVPLYQEHYELVIPEIYYHSPLLAPFLDTLVDPAFRAAVAAMPGYGVARMGQLIAEVS